MQRANFKKIGNYLAFNSAGSEPIFLILQELEDGYMYFLETMPFGAVNYVHKRLVVQEEEEVKEEKASGRK